MPQIFFKNFSFLLVEVDFLSTWNSVHLFGDFFLLVEIQFLRSNLISASRNWFSGWWKPLFCSTDGFYPFNGNVFVNKPGIVVGQSGFSGHCKTFFYPFSTHWKCVFDTYPAFRLVKTGFSASGNNFFSNLRYSCFFLPIAKLFLQKILYSG